MEAACRDLGLMDYKDCWELQQSLFDLLIARKTSRKGMAVRPAAYPTGYDAAKAACPETGMEPTKARAGKTAPETMPEPASGSGGTPADTGAETKPASPAGTETEPETIARDAGSAGTILLVEHPPVFTLGKSGHAENLLVGREALEAMGAQFFHIDRGGDITFHGPGQLVCYPILDLERLGIGLRDYIEALEEAVIRTVAEYGITAGRIAGASGVWVGGSTESAGTEGRADIRTAGHTKADNSDTGKTGAGGEAANRGRHADQAGYNRLHDGGSRMSGGAPRKICAIGVRSSRYITMHGFALNVTTDLEWFSRINPCGFTDRGVTSIERETRRKVAMDEVKGLVVKFLSEILNVRIYK